MLLGYVGLPNSRAVRSTLRTCALASAGSRMVTGSPWLPPAAVGRQPARDCGAGRPDAAHHAGLLAQLAAVHALAGGVGHAQVVPAAAGERRARLHAAPVHLPWGMTRPAAPIATTLPLAVFRPPLALHWPRVTAGATQVCWLATCPLAAAPFVTPPPCPKFTHIVFYTKHIHTSPPILSPCIKSFACNVGLPPARGIAAALHGSGTPRRGREGHTGRRIWHFSCCSLQNMRNPAD